jgi:glyoxylase-like metal-dependent hydrolase (beta-lactamase superfamily II)
MQELVNEQSPSPVVLDRAVHVFETGWLRANKTFLRGEGFSSLLRRAEPFEFPVLAYVIEHPEGLVVVDTGLGGKLTAPRTFRGFPPVPTRLGEELELGPQMRERGLDPDEVRSVVLTHLDWDHTGGLHQFQAARILVHRPEYEFAGTRVGRARYRTSSWPSGFNPELYDLEDDPIGPFPTSYALTSTGDLRLIPVAGHSPGQVAVVYERGDQTLLFSADHMLRSDWFVEDLRADRLIMLGAFGRRAARRTSRRLHQFIGSRPVLLLPAHDAEAPRRLACGEPTTVD